MRICGRAVEIDPYYAQAWALLAIAQSSLRYGFGQEVDDGYRGGPCRVGDRSDHRRSAFADVQASPGARANRRGGGARWKPRSGWVRNSWEVNKEAGRFYLSRRDVATRDPPLRESRRADGERLPRLGDALDLLPGVGRARRSFARQRRGWCPKSQRAVQQDPSNGAALGILAGGYALLGEMEKTREWIDRALLIDPDNLNMRYNFACVLVDAMRDKEAALKMLQSALARSRAHTKSGSPKPTPTSTTFATIRDSRR